MSSFTLLYTMSSISKMRPENIKLMSTVAVFFCDVAFRLEPDKGPLYVLSCRLSGLFQTATSFNKLIFENSLKSQPRTAGMALLFALSDSILSVSSIAQIGHAICKNKYGLISSLRQSRSVIRPTVSLGNHTDSTNTTSY